MKIFGVNINKQFIATALIASAVVAAVRVGMQYLPDNTVTTPVKKAASLL